MTRNSSATHSYTLDRGLRALSILAVNPDGLTVSELAAELDTHRAAVYRLLGPLADHRLIRREDNGRLVLGAGLVTLAAAVGQRLVDVSEPVLRELSERLGATTALTIRDGDEGVVARVVVPRAHDVHLTYRQGMRHPLTSGAPGHALLATAPRHEDEPDFVTRARDCGYAISRGQLLPGATGVAAAIQGPTHEPDAALSAVWIEGIDPEDAARAVLAAAAEIGGRLSA